MAQTAGFRRIHLDQRQQCIVAPDRNPLVKYFDPAGDDVVSKPGKDLVECFVPRVAPKLFRASEFQKNRG